MRAYSQVADSRVVVEGVLSFGEGRGAPDCAVQHHIAAQAATVSRCRRPRGAIEGEALVRARVGVLRAHKVGPEPTYRERELELGFVEIHLVAVIPEQLGRVALGALLFRRTTLVLRTALS